VLGSVMYGAVLSKWATINSSVVTLFIMILGGFDTYSDSKCKTYFKIIISYSKFLICLFHSPFFF
jgi:hypothetical protein